MSSGPTYDELQAMVGERVEAQGIFDVPTSGTVNVVGVLQEGDHAIFYVETEDNRHIQVQPNTVSLLPEEDGDTDEEFAFAITVDEVTVIRSLVEGVPVWQRPSFMAYVASVTGGQEQAQIFFRKLGFIPKQIGEPGEEQETSDELSEADDGDTPETPLQCSTAGCTMPLGHSGRHGYSLSRMATVPVRRDGTPPGTPLPLYGIDQVVLFTAEQNNVLQGHVLFCYWNIEEKEYWYKVVLGRRQYDMPETELRSTGTAD